MKLLSKKFEKDGEGTLKIMPTQPEDMWHAYNLVAKGDVVTATALRKVKSESVTGSVDTKKVRTTLTLTVISIEFDPESCHMRVGGRTTAGSTHVSAGQHHTLDLELSRPFAITKERWDLIALDRIDTACNVAKSADVAAVTMQSGLANLCLVTSSMTIVASKIEVAVPRKGKDRIGTQHEKGLARFFGKMVEAVNQHIDFDVVKCVLLCSSGHLKEQFLQFLLSEAVRTDNKTLIKNKAKFMLVPASSGHKHALNEVLADPSVLARLSDTKAAGEVKALDDFYKMLDKEPDKAFYGYNHVNKANEASAIETLMVSDGLFRSNNISTRRKYVALVEAATDNGAQLKIFSSLHVSGEKLGNLSGVAAILRFPVPGIDDTDDEDDSSSDDDRDDDAAADGS